MRTKSALEVAQLVSQKVVSQNSVSNAIFEFCCAILIIKVSHLELEDANLFYLIRYLQSIKLIVHRLIYTSSVVHATFIRYISPI